MSRIAAFVQLEVGAVGGSNSGVSSAVSLREVPQTGNDLQPLRPRSNLLFQGMFKN